MGARSAKLYSVILMLCCLGILHPYTAYLPRECLTINTPEVTSLADSPPIPSLPEPTFAESASSRPLPSLPAESELLIPKSPQRESSRIKGRTRRLAIICSRQRGRTPRETHGFGKSILPRLPKKFKSFHDKSTGPDVGIPAAARIVPFPEKVR